MKPKEFFAFHAVIIAAFGFLSACTEQEEAQTFSEPVLSTLEVTVEYDTLGELPEESVISLRLEDVTNGVSSGFTLAEIEASDLGESPYTANLAYDGNLITDSRDYRLTAVLEHEGKPLGSTATLGNPLNSEPLVMGIYELPLSAQNAYNTLTLLGPFWVVKAMAGEVLELSDPRARPNIQLAIDSESYGGFAGCNRYTGSYSLDGTRIELGAAAATRKFCEQSASLEQAFLSVLDRTTRWRMEGPELVFANSDGEEIARFEAYDTSQFE